jgi:hypothetical protein
LYKQSFLHYTPYKQVPLAKRSPCKQTLLCAIYASFQTNMHGKSNLFTLHAIQTGSSRQAMAVQADSALRHENDTLKRRMTQYDQNMKSMQAAHEQEGAALEHKSRRALMDLDEVRAHAESLRSQLAQVCVYECVNVCICTY